MSHNDWALFERDAEGRLDPAIIRVTDLEVCLSYDVLGGLTVLDPEPGGRSRCRRLR